MTKVFRENKTFVGVLVLAGAFGLGCEWYRPK